MGTQILEFYFGQSHSQHFKGAEILGLADAWKVSSPVAYNWRWGLSAPFSLPSAHSAWGSPPRLWSSLLPMGPQLSLHLQPSPLSQNAGVDTQWPAGPLYPDNSRACLEAAPFFLTSALPDLTPSAAGTIPETWVSSSSSSFSLLHPTQSNSNSVDQSPQSLAVCPLLSIPLSL